jgi:TP901 family phage tail tape measure protein
LAESSSNLAIRITAQNMARAAFQQAEGDVDSLHGKLSGFAMGAAALGAGLTTALTLPIVGLGAAAVRSAADYEGSMNLFQAVTNATGEQMAQVGQIAKQLGADMTLPATSAADAGKAMTELAKAGLSVDNVMMAAKGTLQLAAAGSLEEAQAATIAANALNAFHLSGEKASMVANLLAATAIASSVEVVDMADAFKMAASVFSTFQGPVVGAENAMIDLSTAIGIMGNAGIKGSDAGTSLKQMLLQLTGPSGVAKDAMLALAIAAADGGASMEKLDVALTGTKKQRAAALEELKQGAAAAGVDVGKLGDIAYDSSGQMRPLEEIVRLTSAGTANMTDELRNYALTQIFGADATRAITSLMYAQSDQAKELGQDWDTMREAVTRETAAADLAGARMAGLNGAFEGLQSQLETVGLVLAEPFLGFLNGVVRGVADLVGGITSLDPHLIAAVEAFAAVLAAVGPLVLVVAGLAAAVAFLISPLGLATVAVGLLAAAFAGDFAGIRTIVESHLTEINSIVQHVLAGEIPEAFSELGQLLQAMGPEIAANLGAMAEAFRDWLGEAIPPMLEKLGELKDALFGWIADVAPGIAQQLVSTWIPAFVGWVLSGGLVGHLLRNLDGGVVDSIIGWIDDTVPRIAYEFRAQWVPAFVAWIAGTAVPAIVGALAAAVPEIAGALTQMLTGASDQAQSRSGPRIIQLAVHLAQAFIGGWRDMWLNLGGMLADWLREHIEQAVSAVLGWVGDRAGEIGSAISNGIASGVQQASSAVTDATGLLFDSIEARGQEGLDGWGMLFDAMGTTAHNAMTGIVETITSLWGMVPEDIRQDLELIVSTLAERGAEMLAVVRDGWGEIVQAVGNAMSEVGSAIQTGWDTATGIVGGAMSAIGSAVHAGWEAATTAVVGAMSAIGSAISAGWDAATSIIGGALSAIGSAIQSAWSGFVSIIAGVSAEILGVIGGWKDQILAILGSIAGVVGSAAREIGTQFINGIIQGAQGMAGALGGALTGVVRTGLQQAKDALGIKSPSEETAEEIGVPLILGIALGLQRAYPELAHAIDGIADEASQDFSEAGERMTTATAGAITAGVPKGKGAAHSFFNAITEVARDAQMVEQFGQQGAKAVSAISDAFVTNSPQAGAKAANAIQSMLEAAEKQGVQGARELGVQIMGTLGTALTTHNQELLAQGIAMIEELADAMKDRGTAKMVAAFDNMAQKSLDQLRLKMSPEVGGGMANVFTDSLANAIRMRTPEAVKVATDYANKIMDGLRSKLTPEAATEATLELLDAIQEAWRSGDMSGLDVFFDRYSAVIDDNTGKVTAAIDRLGTTAMDQLRLKLSPEEGGGVANVFMGSITAVLDGGSQEAAKYMQDLAGKVMTALRTHLSPADAMAATQEFLDALNLAIATGDMSGLDAFFVKWNGALVDGFEKAKKPARDAAGALMAAVSEMATNSEMVEKFGQTGAKAVAAIGEAFKTGSTEAGTKAGNAIQQMVDQAAKIGVPGARELGAQIIAMLEEGLKTHNQDLINTALGLLEGLHTQMASKIASDGKDKLTKAINDLGGSMTENLRIKLSPAEGGGIMNVFLDSVKAAIDPNAENPAKLGQHAIQLGERVLKGVTDKMNPTQAIAVTDQFMAALNDALRNGDLSGLLAFIQQYGGALTSGLTSAHSAAKQTAHRGLTELGDVMKERAEWMTQSFGQGVSGMSQFVDAQLAAIRQAAAAMQPINIPIQYGGTGNVGYQPGSIGNIGGIPPLTGPGNVGPNGNLLINNPAGNVVPTPGGGGGFTLPTGNDLAAQQRAIALEWADDIASAFPAVFPSGPVGARLAPELASLLSGGMYQNLDQIVAYAHANGGDWAAGVQALISDLRSAASYWVPPGGAQNYDGPVFLANGGIVTRPTLAMIGEAGPEAVIPLSRGGAGREVHNHYHFDGPTYGILDFERRVEAIVQRANRDR